MAWLVLFGALGIATLYFYKKIAQRLFKMGFFKKFLNQKWVSRFVIWFGVFLILAGFLFYYSGNGERETMDLLNSPEILDILKNTP